MKCGHFEEKKNMLFTKHSVIIDRDFQMRCYASFQLEEVQNCRRSKVEVDKNILRIHFDHSKVCSSLSCKEAYYVSHLKA